MNQQEHYDFTVKEWLSKPFLDLLKKAFETNDVAVVFDIGACVGGFSQIILSDLFTPIEKVFCFEPDKENYDFLIKKLGTRVEAFNKGICYGPTKLPVKSFQDGNPGGYFIGEPYREGQVVELGRDFELSELEDFFIPSPDLIKLDVEGAEKNIIMNSSLFKITPKLIIEWHWPESAEEFFKKHLPQHNIAGNIDNKMFLLTL